MSIFTDWAHRYWEYGYNVIPVVESTGASAVKNWQQWSDNRQTEEDVDQMVEQFANCQAIGLVCGKATNFSAIDIDCDLTILDQYLPWHTSMIRRAAKGHVFHVAYIDPKTLLIDTKTGEAKTNVGKQNIPAIADMLLEGSYVIAPPSIHKDGLHIYRWVKDTGIVAASQLDRLDLAEAETIYHKCLDLRRQLDDQAQDKAGYSSTASLTDNILGRNDYLSKAAYAMAHKIRDSGGGQELVDQKVRELLELDSRHHHDNPWFTDVREAHKGKNPEAVARRMIMQKLRVVEKVNIIEVGKDYVNRIRAKLKARTPGNDIAFESKQWKDLLPEGGVYELFYELCKQEQGTSASVALSMASCTGMIAAGLSNKRRFQQTWPNVYVWALAPSGVGKNAPPKVAQKIMMKIGETGLTLLGPSKYASSNAFIGLTARKRERVDFIDEITLMYQRMNSKGDPLFGMRDNLVELFSSSSKVFTGVAAQTKDAQMGVVANPCISFVGSGVLTRFANILTDTDFEQGLLARSLVFIEDGKDILENESFTAYGWSQENNNSAKLENELLADIVSKLQALFNEPFNQKTYEVANPVDPKAYEYQPSLEALHNQYGRAALEKSRELALSESPRDMFLSAAYNRKIELMMKLEQIYAVSQSLSTITEEAFFWANDVWELQTQAQMRYLFARLDEINADPKELLEIDIYEMMLKELTATGKPVVGYNDIRRKVKSRSRKNLQKNRELLNSWVQLAQKEGKVVKQTVDTGKGQKKLTLVFNLEEI